MQCRVSPTKGRRSSREGRSGREVIRGGKRRVRPLGRRQELRQDRRGKCKPTAQGMASWLLSAADGANSLTNGMKDFWFQDKDQENNKTLKRKYL